MLYLLHVGLIETYKRKVVLDYILYLVDDWHAFNRLPWGKVVWAMTSKSISWAIQIRYKDASSRHWLYIEDIPSLKLYVNGISSITSSNLIYCIIIFLCMIMHYNFKIINSITFSLDAIVNIWNSRQSRYFHGLQGQRQAPSDVKKENR